MDLHIEIKDDTPNKNYFVFAKRHGSNEKVEIPPEHVPRVIDALIREAPVEEDQGHVFAISTLSAVGWRSDKTFTRLADAVRNLYDKDDFNYEEPGADSAVNIFDIRRHSHRRCDGFHERQRTVYCTGQRAFSRRGQTGEATACMHVRRADIVISFLVIRSSVFM
jgi:hypothetical protein